MTKAIALRTSFVFLIGTIIFMTLGYNSASERAFIVGTIMGLSAFVSLLFVCVPAGRKPLRQTSAKVIFKPTGFNPA